MLKLRNIAPTLYGVGIFLAAISFAEGGLILGPFLSKMLDGVPDGLSDEEVAKLDDDLRRLELGQVEIVAFADNTTGELSIDEDWLRSIHED